jgi:hypothetical protein
LENWRSRLAARGSRCDSPYFENLAQTTGSLPVWQGATRVNNKAPVTTVLQRILDILGSLAQAENP